jgi:cell division protein FtsZ
MSGAGSALMGIGSSRGDDRAVAAAEMAISSPLLEASIDGAHGVLLSIQGGSDLGLFEINEAAQLVSNSAAVDANIIFGAVIDDALGDEVRVTVIAAGFDEQRPGRPAGAAAAGNASTAASTAASAGTAAAGGASAADGSGSGGAGNGGFGNPASGSSRPGGSSTWGSSTTGNHPAGASGTGASGTGTSGPRTVVPGTIVSETGPGNADTGGSAPAASVPKPAAPMTSQAGPGVPAASAPAPSASGNGGAGAPAGGPANGTGHGKPATSADDDLADAPSAQPAGSGYVPAPVSFVSPDGDGEGDYSDDTRDDGAFGAGGPGWKDSGRHGNADKTFDVNSSRRRPVVFEEEDDLDVPDFLK